MMCCPPSGYIILSLIKLKFCGCWGTGVEEPGPCMRAGYQRPDNPRDPLKITFCFVTEVIQKLSQKMHAVSGGSTVLWMEI